MYQSLQYTPEWHRGKRPAWRTMMDWRGIAGAAGELRAVETAPGDRSAATMSACAETEDLALAGPYRSGSPFLS